MPQARTACGNIVASSPAANQRRHQPGTSHALRYKMMNPLSRPATLLVLVLIAGAASAASDIPWDGIYAGLNAGEARNNACNSGTLTGATIDPAFATAFYNPSCPNNSSFVGGLQVGDNFQHKHLVVGIGADLDAWSGKNHSISLSYTGAVPPPGTYAFSGKTAPNGFAVIGPTIGYGTLQFLSYIKVGGAITDGSHNSTLSYTPAGSKIPTASFSGGKSFASTGWAAGGGFEYGLNGPWSISAEYLYVNLGKGSDSASTCSGTAAACAAFSGISFDGMHGSFTANTFRIGITHWFSYWNL
jgi:outer membrane immunogenic protein